MKKFLFIFAIILFSVTGVLAQTPNIFSYQAVLRSADGNIIAGEVTEMEIQITAGSTGASIFEETHIVTTTAQGLVNLRIGSVEDMSGIDWGEDTYFIKVMVNGATMGISQILSVPLCFARKNCGKQRRCRCRPRERVEYKC